MSLKKQDLINLWEELSSEISTSLKKQILEVTGRGGCSASRDYISANAYLVELKKVCSDLSTIETKAQGLALMHPAVRFRLSYYTPCLAYRYDELKPAEQKEIFDSKKWVFTEKQNGVRGNLIYYKGDTFLFSRNYSDADCDILEYFQNIFQTPVSVDEIYAIDVELKFEPDMDLQGKLEHYGLTTDSRLEAMSAMLQMHKEDAVAIQQKFKQDTGRDLLTFRLIAPLYYNGKNYIKRSLGEGIDVYDEVVEHGQKLGFNVKPIKRCLGSREEKEAFLNAILDEGGEGIVAHNREGSYVTSENRSKASWVKLKRSVRASLEKSGMGDSIDGWISGFKLGSEGTQNDGLVSALQISIFVRRADGTCYEHVVANVPNIAREVKIQITDSSVNPPVLKEDLYGMVCEVDGQCISKVSKQLTHPRLLRFRADKSKEECIYSKEFLESQID